MCVKIETLRIGGKLSDAVGRKPFLMLGPAANILFGPLSFSDLGFGCPDDMRKAWNYHGVVFVFILSPTLLYKIFPQQKSETVLTKGLQFPTKTKGFQHVNIVKNCFFQCFLLKPSIPETDGVIQKRCVWWDSFVSIYWLRYVYQLTSSLSHVYPM